jgi:hypothetical protein
MSDTLADPNGIAIERPHAEGYTAMRLDGYSAQSFNSADAKRYRFAVKP